MKVEQIAEGAFFVPPHYIPNVESHVPGLINLGVVNDIEIDQDKENEEGLTREAFDHILRRIRRSVKQVAAKE